LNNLGTTSLHKALVGVTQSMSWAMRQPEQEVPEVAREQEVVRGREVVQDQEVVHYRNLSKHVSLELTL